MAAFSSPMRLAPPMTPRRAPSPSMLSPGGRRGRMHGISEEGHLRDLSPDTTLRAFTQRPIPFDTSCDEYKIFSCIETLTAAERDLGARVAKAAQRLKSWCSEIEQWGWSGSFEQPSQEFREQRRRSLELRIREHVGDADLTDALPPLEYWGSLLSVEVESHEARLDDIEEEMLKLDVEELKEHVLDMHPTGRSRPSSAGFEASRQNYKPMDDFSFLITQTLLSALPAHSQLKERLNTWTARISTLREVPRYVNDLSTAQKAMRLGWNAIDPPADTSDEAFVQWKEAVDTISGVLANKVTDLGKRLDRMLDTLEGRDDCIPDNWIDVFEGIETDYGRWTHESRRKVIDFDVRRKYEKKGFVQLSTITNNLETHPMRKDATQQTIETPVSESTLTTENINSAPPSKSEAVAQILANGNNIPNTNADGRVYPMKSTAGFANIIEEENPPARDFGKDTTNPYSPRILSPGKVAQHAAVESNVEHRGNSYTEPQSPVVAPEQGIPRGLDSPAGTKSSNSTPSKKPWFMVDTVVDSTTNEQINDNNTDPLLAGTPVATVARIPELSYNAASPVENTVLYDQIPELLSPIVDDESEFEEGDTVVYNEYEEEPEFEEGNSVVHHDLDASPEAVAPVLPLLEGARDTHSRVDEKSNGFMRLRHRPSNLSDIPTITTNDGQDGPMQDPPQTPRSRRDSEGSISSNISFDSSPPGFIDDSPSVRNATNRSVRVPRPELNAAMAKRRLGKTTNDNIVSAPWLPTQFSQKSSAEDLERKISDILTTIPAHIRLTSGPGVDAPEVQPTRGLAAKGSRAYLRAARSISGLKSPTLTLSPAKSEFDNAVSGRKSAASARSDNDIKLYHLTQPGKEQPVKLFIRRVGENGERVMVRVGGGWADLGEYLRQYAEHHGRRTASDSKFEILGLEVKNNDSTNSPNRSESAMSKRERAFSSGRPTASPLTTPTKGNTSRDDAVPPMPSFVSTTPGLLDDHTIPSTNSSRRSWTGDEVGLSGPKAKKLDLSGEKLEWIEGMMKQARTVSGRVMTPSQREERPDSRSESRSDSRAGGKKPEFGDLGKVGGTKRIFLRGGKPVLE